MRNKELASEYTSKNCEACGSIHNVVGHHIISFKSRPDLDIPQNIMALCYICHNQVHTMGRDQFIRRYQLEKNLRNRGFYFDDYAKKWRFGK